MVSTPVDYPDRVDLKTLNSRELREFVLACGLKSYRAEQIRAWIYQRCVPDISAITVLSKAVREEISRRAYVSGLGLLKRQRSSDGAEKFLWRLADGKAVESVFIPEDDRRTLCISSQAGCAMDCTFCFTATGGLFGPMTFTTTVALFDSAPLLSRIV